MSQSIKFLDLFAGAGGLSEGFMRAGFAPIAHVESDASACFTLRTRMAMHWLRSNGMESHYVDYLNQKITRTELYKLVPDAQIQSVINKKIGKDTLSDIFEQIDLLLNHEKLDLIIGGPPCQAYSVIGRSRGNMVGDERNLLYVYYAEFLKQYKPRYFVFENVLGLLSAKDEVGDLYFDKMRQLFNEVGYSTEYMVLSSDQYGVLQNRKRVILVGKRGSRVGFYPEPEKWNPQTELWDLFSDLPKIKAGEGHFSPCRMEAYSGTWLYDAGIKSDLPVTWHQSRPNTAQDLEIYRIAVELWNSKKLRLEYNMLPERLRSHRESRSFTDRFKVVAGDLHYSHTMVAHISKDGHHYIHPDIEQNRSLTPREAARIQSFPDDYFFENVSIKPARTSAFKQIGNAVPVLLASKIAEKLIQSWD